MPAAHSRPFRLQYFVWFGWVRCTNSIDGMIFMTLSPDGLLATDRSKAVVLV